MIVENTPTSVAGTLCQIADVIEKHGWTPNGWRDQNGYSINGALMKVCGFPEEAFEKPDFTIGDYAGHVTAAYDIMVGFNLHDWSRQQTGEIVVKRLRLLSGQVHLNQARN